MSKLKELFSTPRRAAVAAACFGVVLVVIGACVAIIASGAGGPEPVSAIGGEAAQNYAFADAGVDPVSAQAVQVRYRRFQGEFVYEVEFLAGETEYAYKINAADGSVEKKEQKTVKGPGNSVPAAGALTLEQAREIALADAGVALEQAVFARAEQDAEGGIPIYGFKFYGGNVEYEYEINGQTGAVYSKRTTTYVGQGGGEAPSPVQTGAPATAEPTPAPSRPPAAQAPGPTQPSGGYIGAEAAKSAALADAGVSAGEARFTKVRMDYEGGVLVYELEFYTAAHQYEYEIHAQTGAVFSRHVEARHSSPGATTEGWPDRNEQN